MALSAHPCCLRYCIISTADNATVHSKGRRPQPRDTHPIFLSKLSIFSTPKPIAHLAPPSWSNVTVPARGRPYPHLISTHQHRPLSLPHSSVIRRHGCPIDRYGHFPRACLRLLLLRLRPLSQRQGRSSVCIALLFALHITLLYHYPSSSTKSPPI